MLRDHPIDDAVVLRLFGGHEVVALGVVADLVVVLLRVLRDDVVEALADVDDLLGVDLDVCGLALEGGADLVNQDLRVGQRHALALGAAGEQQRAHRHRDADADRLHVGLDELHRVVDREAGVDGAARRVDVERDVLVGVVRLEVEELGDDQVGDLVRDGRAEEDDSLVEEARVDVEGALPTGGLLDDHRNEWAHRAGQSSYEPGVQICPAPSSFSLSGVQSLSRAAACSTGIGLALSTSRSTALRSAMSSRSASSAPCERARLSARWTCLSLASGPAASRSACSISSSETSRASASTIAASTASRLSACSASGSDSVTNSSSSLPTICRYWCGSMPCWASRREVRCHISCALAWTSSCGISTSAAATAASTAASRSSPSIWRS